VVAFFRLSALLRVLSFNPNIVRDTEQNTQFKISSQMDFIPATFSQATGPQCHHHWLRLILLKKLSMSKYNTTPFCYNNIDLF
jgi:hypothetical protein